MPRRKRSRVSSTAPVINPYVSLKHANKFEVRIETQPSGGQKTIVCFLWKELVYRIPEEQIKSQRIFVQDGSCLAALHLTDYDGEMIVVAGAQVRMFDQNGVEMLEDTPELRARPAAKDFMEELEKS